MQARTSNNANGTLRDNLRRQTADIHEGLHRHGSFVALFEGRLSRHGYLELLRRFFSFYLPLDQAIARVLAGGANETGDFRYVARSPILAQDLLDLGDSPLAIRDQRLCQQTQDLVSSRSIGGVLYVVEGSVLGSKVINKAAARLLGAEETSGRRHWSWCTSVQHERWGMMIRYLELLEASGISHDEMIAGARDTFQLLADWLMPIDSAPVPRGESNS